MSFEKKIKKLDKAVESGWKYLDRLSSYSSLTVGFWNNHGNRINSLLVDLEKNHFEEFEEYDRTKQGYSKEHWNKICLGFYEMPVVSDYYA